jgi:hypothetical protein
MRDPLTTSEDTTILDELELPGRPDAVLGQECLPPNLMELAKS